MNRDSNQTAVTKRSQMLNHVIIHVRGGSVVEVELPNEQLEYEIWDHDECDTDEGTKENCPTCREEK